MIIFFNFSYFKKEKRKEEKWSNILFDEKVANILHQF